MGKPRILAGTALAALIAGPGVAHAVIYGSLANFDVVNDTGKPAYGFEIEIEDATYDHTKITSVFGYDRNFGLPGGPGAVVRYGIPAITDLPTGVLIKYGGSLAGPSTPFGAYNTPGDSCWPLGGGWSLSASCDHFGVSTLGQPAKTRYSWLVETAPGVLGPTPAGVPAVNFVYNPPPAVGQPAQLRAEIRAEVPDRDDPENEGIWGEPFWVKTFATKVPNNVDLRNLFRDDPGQEDAEVETEWEIFQRAPAGENGENDDKFGDVALGDGDAAAVRRYEFYKYVGPLKADGEADCSGHDCSPDTHPDYLGAYVGAQMAGFNVAENQAPIALIPEPETYALMVAGLGVLGAAVRRKIR